MKQKETHTYARMKSAIAQAVVACIVVTQAWSPFAAIPTAEAASSFRPTIFVNTEAFLNIDDDDTSANVVLRFGDTLAKTLTFNRSLDRFEFNDDVYVTGTIQASDTVSGAVVYGAKSLRSSGSLVWEGTASGSQLYVGGNVGIGGTSTTKARLDVHGSISGSSIRINGGGVIGNNSFSSPDTIYFTNNTSFNNSFAANQFAGTSIFSGYVGIGDNVADQLDIYSGNWVLNNDTNLTISGGQNGLSFDTDTLSVDAAGDKIGIGTTAPKAKLEVMGVMSGITVYATKSFSGAGLSDCDTAGTSKLLWDSTTGRFSCGTDTDTNTTYTAGQGLALNGTSFRLNATVTGSLARFATVSGSTIFAKDTLASSGSIILKSTTGNADMFVTSTVAHANGYFDAATGNNAALRLRENTSTKWSLLAQGTTDNFIIAGDGGMAVDDFVTITQDGNVGIGPGSAMTPKAKLAVAGTISGTTLYAMASFSGAGLSDCDTAGTSKLLWDATTGRFSCGTDAGATYTAGQGLNLNGTSFRLNTTVTGAVIQAANSLASSGSLSWKGAGSGKSIAVMQDSYFLGNVAFGATTAETKLEVAGTASGGMVYAERQLSTSGSATLGEDSNDNVVFNADVNSNILPNTNNSFDVGSSSARWANGWFNNANLSANISVLGTSSLTGNVGIGSANSTTKAVLNVSGVMSGITVYATKSFSGAGLSDCDTAGTSKLLWDTTTGRFSCGTDTDTNTTYTAGQGLTLTSTSFKVNSTLTGSMLRFLTVSGSTVFAKDTLTSSGTIILKNTTTSADLLVTSTTSNANAYFDSATNTNAGLILRESLANKWTLLGQGTTDNFVISGDGGLGTDDFLTIGQSGNVGIGPGGSMTPKAKLAVTGTISGTTLYALNSFSGAGLTSCSNGTTDKLLWNATTGRFSCGTDQSGSYTAGQGLSLNGTSFKVNSTLTGTLLKFATATGSLARFLTVSGSTVYAKNSLVSSGTLVTESNATVGGDLTFTKAGTTTIGMETIVSGAGRSLSIAAGNGSVIGGDVTISGGAGDGGGSVTVKGGPGAADGGGRLYLLGGTDSVGGDTFVAGGDGSATDGNLFLAHNGTQVVGNISIGTSVTPKALVHVQGILSGVTLYATKSFSGAGLTDCSNGTTSKLLWNATTGRFSCGTDQSGSASYTAGQGLSLSAGNAFSVNSTLTGTLLKFTTATGTLVRFATVSGSTVYAKNQFTVAGTGSSPLITTTTVKPTVRIGGSGSLVIEARSSDPGSAPANTASLFAQKVGGRAMLHQGSGSTFAASPLQNAFYGNLIMALQPGGGTTVNGIGTTVTNDTTVSHPAADQTFGYMTNFATAATSGDDAGTSSANTAFFRGSTAGANGFFFAGRVGVVDTTSIRVFSGMADQTISTMVSADNPAGNYVGFSFSTVRGDTNWQFITKDNTTQNVVNTGLAFTANKVYDVYFTCTKQCASITWEIRNVTDGTSATGTTSSNLPTTSTALRMVLGVESETTTAKNIRMQQMYVEADR